MLAIVDTGASMSPAMIEPSGARLAVATRSAGRGERVPAVACFGQRVGPEAQPNLVGDDVVDDVVVSPRVEVVYELCALVAEEPRVFETDRTLHAPNSSGIRLAHMGPNGHDVAARLAKLEATDRAIAEQARVRVTAYRRANRIGDEPYIFPTYKSAEERKVWVHKWWVRPMRFFYRHLPAAVRSRIKRVAT